MSRDRPSDVRFSVISAIVFSAWLFLTPEVPTVLHK